MKDPGTRNPQTTDDKDDKTTGSSAQASVSHYTLRSYSLQLTAQLTTTAALIRLFARAGTGIDGVQTSNLIMRMTSMNPIARAIALLLVCVLCIDICSASYALNYTCSPPYSMGGKGYCGPNFCDTSASTLYGCNFTNTVISYSTIVANTKTKTCTQSTDARCTSAALAALMHGPGIKAAFCNDAFLVILSDLTAGFTTHLNSIKNPPAAVDHYTGKTCVTRYANPEYQSLKIPLFPVMLSTADPSINNVNLMSFPNGPGSDSDGSYMSTTTGAGATYGLPVRGTYMIIR